MLLDINKLKERTQVGVKKHFIYTYQISLENRDELKFKSSADLNKYLDGVIVKYNKLTLDRLWYALYLETSIIILKEHNMYLLLGSINKTLNQLDTIDLGYVEEQISLIRKILQEENVSLLIERPFVGLKLSNEKLLKQIVNSSEDLIKELSSYEDCFDYKKIIQPLGFVETKEYMAKMDAIIESWYTFAYFFISDEAMPLMKSILFEKNDEEVTKDLMDYFNINEEDLEKEMGSEFNPNISPFDLYLEDEYLNEKLFDYLIKITNKKRDTNLLIPILNKHIRKLINNYI